MANPILAQTGGTAITLRIRYQSSCKNPIYGLYNPSNVVSPIFSGEVSTPSLCGEAVIDIKDAGGLRVLTPTVKVCGPYITWTVKDGQGDTVGYVESPNCAQLCEKQYCPWKQSVVLRATDVSHVDRFTIRAPGCCDNLCQRECCETRCGCVLLPCACGKFAMKIPVYDHDMKKTSPVAEFNWAGARECWPPYRVFPGYTWTITPPAGVTYNDTCLLVLLSIYLDSLLVLKQIPIYGE
jgi:hypothetical protein